MGIRSIVGIATEPKHKEKLMSFIDQIGQPDKEIDENDRFAIKYDHIKWYADFYKSIEELMEWLRSLPDEEWGFIEICEGDEGPHITTEGTPYIFDLFYTYDVSL